MTSRQQTAAKTREKLVNAAKEIICEKGLTNTSIDEITERCGVAKGTFYLYFQDKNEIWDAVVARVSNHILLEAKEALEQRNLPDMIDRILFVADYVIEYFRKNILVLRMIRRDFSWPLVLKKMEQEQDNTLLQMLDQCFCSPYLSRYSMEESYRMMFIIMEMVGSISYTSILHDQPAPIDEMKPVLFHTIRKILL